MTPQEKAGELFNKMKYSNTNTSILSHGEAKRCALIAVDEIIKNGGTHYIIEYKPNSYTNQVWFWQEVKEELEKL